MSVDRLTRERIAADLLLVDRTKTPDVPAELQRRLRAMTPAERRALTERIDGVLAWLADYEAEEARINEWSTRR